MAYNSCTLLLTEHKNLIWIFCSVETMTKSLWCLHILHGINNEFLNTISIHVPADRYLYPKDNELDLKKKKKKKKAGF